MSAYQYYEFHALDQPLSDQAQDDVRSLSRRITLTPPQAIFVYHDSDFPDDCRAGVMMVSEGTTIPPV